MPTPERLNNKRADLVVVALTSQIPATFSEDELLLSGNDLTAGGLPKASVLKLGKVFTIHQALIRKKLGQLPEATVKTILQKLKQSLDD